jgi:hypothetical protein
MNCRQAKLDIALWIGEDLTDGGAREELRRHVGACPPCRAHYRRMKKTIGVLEHADREATYESSDSVWPELAKRLDQRARRPMQGHRFNGWLPFAAMTVACLLLVFVMANPTSPTSPGETLKRDVVPFPSFPPPLDYGNAPEAPTGTMEPERADVTRFRTIRTVSDGWE